MNNFSTDEDQAILNRVERVLFHDHLIHPQDVKVIVSHGTVTVEGQVSERKLKTFADEAISDVFGVLEVRNNLTLKPDHGLIGNMNWPI